MKSTVINTSEAVKSITDLTKAASILLTRVASLPKLPKDDEVRPIEAILKHVSSITQSRARAMPDEGLTPGQRNENRYVRKIKAEAIKIKSNNEILISDNKLNATKDLSKRARAKIKGTATQKLEDFQNARFLLNRRGTIATHKTDRSLTSSIVRQAMRSGDPEAIKALQETYAGKKDASSKEMMINLQSAIVVATSKGIADGWKKVSEVASVVMGGRFASNFLSNQASVGIARGVNLINNPGSAGSSVASIMNTKAQNTSNILSDAGAISGMLGGASFMRGGVVSGSLLTAAGLGLNIAGSAITAKAKQKSQQAEAVVNVGLEIARMKSSSIGAFGGLSGSNAYLKTFTSDAKLSPLGLIEAEGRLSANQGYRSTSTGRYNADNFMNIQKARGMSGKEIGAFSASQGIIDKFGGPGEKLISRYASSYGTVDINSASQVALMATQSGYSKDKSAQIGASYGHMSPGGQQALTSMLGGTMSSYSRRKFILENTIGINLDTEMLKGGSKESRAIKAAQELADKQGLGPLPETMIYENYAKSGKEITRTDNESLMPDSEVKPNIELMQALGAAVSQVIGNITNFGDAFKHLTKDIEKEKRRIEVQKLRNKYSDSNSTPGWG